MTRVGCCFCLVRPGHVAHLLASASVLQVDVERGEEEFCFLGFLVLANGAAAHATWAVAGTRPERRACAMLIRRDCYYDLSIEDRS